MAEIKWNPQPPTPEPACVCGATNFDEHLAKVIDGHDPHPHPFGDPDNWTR